MPVRTLIAAACLFLCVGATAAFAFDTPSAKALDAFEQAHTMGRGMNVLGYDLVWTDPAKARFKARHFKAIKDGGFQTVRLNLQAFAHMDAANRLDPAWVATLDRLAGVALGQGLTVILDEHDFNACGQDLATCEPRLTAFWRQIAAHYANAPGKLVFEILNEPNGQLDDEAWNRLLAIELAQIRSTNRTRTVIVGPASWNSPQHLEALRLPPGDHHLIVTVHYYAPMEFTHQGAPWTPQFAHLSGVTWGTQEDLQKLDQDFSRVDHWAAAHERPILLGEFGAYEKGDMGSRVRYISAVARAAERRGWAWAYWQFDSDFIAWDMKRDAWIEPIRQALIPSR